MRCLGGGTPTELEVIGGRGAINFFGETLDQFWSLKRRSKLFGICCGWFSVLFLDIIDLFFSIFSAPCLIPKLNTQL